jgi:hypothetical protein
MKMAVVIEAWLTAACTTASAQYDKAGVTDEERRRDRTECAWTSITGRGVRRGFALFRIDRSAYEQCMSDRGYTIRTAT